MNRRSWTLPVLAALVFSACAKDAERAPPADLGCTGDKCGKPVTPIGKQPDGGDGDGGSDAPSSDAGARSVGGEVGVLDESLTTVVPFDGSFRLIVEADAGGYVDQNFDGNTFSVDGVAGETAWVGLERATGSFDVLGTLAPLAPGVTTASLAFVRRSTMELILNVLTNPVVLDDTKGHAIVRFLVGANPAAGVSIVDHPGAVLAFDDSGSWTDASTATSDRGYAVIANAPAVEMPGAKVPVVFDDGTTQAKADIPFARGSVTLVDIQLDP